MKDKTVVRWFSLNIHDWYDRTHNLSHVYGIVEESNFLDEGCPFCIDVITEHFDGVELGDVIKISLYTKESKIVKDDIKKTLAFADNGLKYEKLVYDTWELLYEDFPEQTSESCRT